MKRLSLSLVCLGLVIAIAGCRAEPSADGLDDLAWADLVFVFPSEPSEPTPEELANDAARKRLERKVSLDLNDGSLGEAISSLRDQTGANIAVNWPALELVGIDPDSLVVLILNDVPAQQALRLTLEQVSADTYDDDKAGFSVIDGVVEISRLHELRAYTEIRIYDIHDLIYQSAAFSESLYQGQADTQTFIDLLREGDGRVFHALVAPDFDHPPEFDLNDALS